MADGTCDYAGCVDTHVRPAILRVEREPGDPGHIQDAARQFELCNLHTVAMMDWVRSAEQPFDESLLDPPEER